MTKESEVYRMLNKTFLKPSQIAELLVKHDPNVVVDDRWVRSMRARKVVNPSFSQIEALHAVLTRHAVE